MLHDKPSPNHFVAGAKATGIGLVGFQGKDKKHRTPSENIAGLQHHGCTIASP